MRSAGAPLSAGERSPDAPAFARVLCAVDGSRTAREGARQAAILTAPDGELELVAVAWATGTGLVEMADLSPHRAEQALEEAAAEAKALGARVTTTLVEGRHAPSLLVARAREHDLLVVGSHGHTRAGGMILGSAATAAVHEAPGPVLVARRPPAGVDFPATVLLASDGSEGAGHAAEAVARIARRHGARTFLLHVGPGALEPARRHALAEQSAALVEATGAEPVLLREDGRPARGIVESARRTGVALVAVGSRGLGGLRALGSVSERVAHEAPCSVLVVRPGAARHA